MITRRVIVIAIIAGQCSLLLGLIALQEYRAHAWQTIRLPVKPVDPEALFRGRYVALGYQFSSVSGPTEGWKEGDRIYVRLVRGSDGLWHPIGFHHNSLRLPGTVELLGTVTGIYRGSVFVRTEIESYFLSERKAPVIEELQGRSYEITVDAGIAPDGRAVLKQLYVQGRPAERFDPSEESAR